MGMTGFIWQGPPVDLPAIKYSINLAIKIDFVAINMDRVINTKCDTIKTASGSFIDNSWRPINQLARTTIGQRLPRLASNRLAGPLNILLALGVFSISISISIFPILWRQL